VFFFVSRGRSTMVFEGFFLVHVLFEGQSRLVLNRKEKHPIILTVLEKSYDSLYASHRWWPDVQSRITALRCNAAIKTLRDRLAERGKSKVDIVGAMRKLLHIYYRVLKNGVLNDPSLHPGT
jgi:hypothetical protein